MTEKKIQKIYNKLESVKTSEKNSTRLVEEMHWNVIRTTLEDVVSILNE